MVDHVQQFKIPREFMYLSANEDSDDNQLATKQFKPTGPDDRSWGDFRKATPTELIIIEELEAI